MRWKVLRFPAVVAIFIVLSGTLSAQNCIPTNINGSVFNLACNQVCADISFQVPDLRSSSDYTVISTPYLPFPYVTATGTEDFALYDDDTYSRVFNLPFPFCFYDQVYAQAVISSNGLVTFDPSNAGCAPSTASWNIVSIIPYAIGAACGASTYPKASIMGVFSDLDPRLVSSPADRKIEWRVEGSAPCRRFVVSFYHIGVYQATTCGRTTPATFQIVMYESTGVIDIFVENKNCSATSPNGTKAILGIQNFTRDKGLAAPGKNAVPWTASNEGYRFVPTGGSSRFVSSELLALDLSHIAWANTASPTAGLLDLTFPVVCSPGASTQYIVKTIFAACDDPTRQLMSMDTITINRSTSLNATSSTTNTACGPPTGTITATVPAGVGTAPYTFVLDGTTTFTGASPHTFTGVGNGAHTVVITDNSGGCSSTLNMTVNQNTALNALVTPTASTCPGINNGSALVLPTGGAAPFTFTMNPGNQVQTGNTANYTGLAAGSYTVSVSDAGGCSTSTPISFTVTAGPALTTTVTTTNALCYISATGTITVTQPTSGTAPYQYSLDGITWQSSNVFTGLVAGTYTVRYRESNGCQGQQAAIISQPPPLAANNAVIPVVCNGQSNGTITITASGGTIPYQYSLNGVTWQNSNVFNVPAGVHTVTIRDNNLCTTTQTVTITEPAALTASAATTNASCNGGADGSITITANGGNSTYQYSINGTTFQASNIFNVIAGTYTATVRDNLGCTVTVPNIIVGLTSNLTYTPPTNPTICEGTSTQLQITSNALQYAWTPSTGLSNPNIANPVANPTTTTNYTVTITLGGCSLDVPVTVNVNAAPIPNAGPDGFICYGQTYQLQASGGTKFIWTPSTFLDVDTIFNPTSTAANTITYTLSVKDANGCQSLVTDNVTVDVTPPITVYTFPYDTIVYQGDQFQLLATSIATDYLWTPSVGLDNPTIPNPVVTAGAPGDVIVYKVTASTFAGCKGEGFVRVQVYKGPDIYMPTGFTPNNDGKNDIFKPFTVGIKQINYFKIFNRWGQELYSTKTLGAGWDGRFGGIEQASGVYVWMVQGVTNDNRLITKKGTVAIIR